MDSSEKRIIELEAALAQVTADRDRMAAQLAETKSNDFDFEKAMARIKARESDNEAYRQQMEEVFAQRGVTTTKFI